MKKMVLAFSSKARMAEFVLDCKITGVETNHEDASLTGFFDEACIQLAVEKYGAYIPNPPDFILP